MAVGALRRARAQLSRRLRWLSEIGVLAGAPLWLARPLKRPVETGITRSCNVVAQPSSMPRYYGGEKLVWMSPWDRPLASSRCVSHCGITTWQIMCSVC